jgi:multiple antibiotic resistance protein
VGAGSWIFRLFSISIPVVQIAGGILICKMGWDLLSSDNPVKSSDGASGQADGKKGQEIEELLFYPMAFPMTTGPGTISVLLTLSAHGHSAHWPTYFENLSALIFSIIIMTILFISVSPLHQVIETPWAHRGLVINRLTAFLVFFVGLQILTGGVTTLIK